MDIPALDRVECAILHDQFNPLDGGVIFEAVKEFSSHLGYASEVQLIASSTSKDIHVNAGGHRVLISQNDEPIGLAGFRTALTTPYTGLVLPNAQDIVRRHKANTFVTIAKGMLDVQLFSEELRKLGDEFVDSLAAESSFDSLGEADRARFFCYWLSKLIIRNNPASAVHWCVSDNLVPQSFFESAGEAGDLALLNIRPILTSSAGRFGEDLPLGMIVSGSQWVIGRVIEFQEARVPLPWMMEVVLGFINLCQVRGSILPHNNSFSDESNAWAVAVYHEKLEGHDSWEKVRLVVVNAPQFGIHGEVTAQRSYTYKNADDVRKRAEEERTEVAAANDPQPYDRRPETVPEAGSSPSGMQTEAAVANDPHREIKITQQKQDMNALRDFAKRSSTSDTPATKSASRDLLSRARGLFSNRR